MEPFGVLIVVVVLVSLLAGIWASRRPPAWDEHQQGILQRESEAVGEAMPPSAAQDEADLRALIDRKRAARGVPPRQPTAPAWGHVEPELLEEARELIARRARRHEREGKPPLDPVAELTRLLGPPHR